MGGLMNLIAYGAQDTYLTANPIILFKRKIKSLQDYAFEFLTEQQKTILYNNCKEIFPKYIELLEKKKKQGFSTVLFDIRNSLHSSKKLPLIRQKEDLHLDFFN